MEIFSIYEVQTKQDNPPSYLSNIATFCLAAFKTDTIFLFCFVFKGT